MSVASCGSNDNSILPEPTPPPAPAQKPAGTNFFAVNGILEKLTAGLSNGEWTFSTPVETYLYEFNDDKMVSCVSGINTGNRNPIIYDEDKITISHSEGAEGVFEFLLENGRITQCNKNGKAMYKWEYDANGRVVRAVSLLTGGGVANSYRATWSAAGDLTEVVCEEITDYTAGRDNFGDRWVITYGSLPLTNHVVIQLPLQRPAAATMLYLKLNPILLAEGYYGNTSPAHCLTEITEYDAS